MSLYVDSSALLKRYIDEPESEACESYLLADPVWITGRHTCVEVRRNLSRLLADPALADARSQFDRDWQRMHVVELDETTCDIAADLAPSSRQPCGQRRDHPAHLRHPPGASRSRGRPDRSGGVVRRVPRQVW